MLPLFAQKQTLIRTSDDDQDPDIPGSGPRTQINQKYQQHGPRSFLPGSIQSTRRTKPAKDDARKLLECLSLPDEPVRKVRVRRFTIDIDLDDVRTPMLRGIGSRTIAGCSNIELPDRVILAFKRWL
jgi:hypothetical protein